MKKLLVVGGYALLIAALTLLVASAAGFIAPDALSIGGQSGLRSIASVAVAGCLLAAIGHWEQ